MIAGDGNPLYSGPPVPTTQYPLPSRRPHSVTTKSGPRPGSGGARGTSGARRPALADTHLFVRLTRTKRCRRARGACPGGVICGNGPTAETGGPTHGPTPGPPPEAPLHATVQPPSGATLAPARRPSPGAWASLGLPTAEEACPASREACPPPWASPLPGAAADVGTGPASLRPLCREVVGAPAPRPVTPCPPGQTPCPRRPRRGVWGTPNGTRNGTRKGTSNGTPKRTRNGTSPHPRPTDPFHRSDFSSSKGCRREVVGAPHRPPGPLDMQVRPLDHDSPRPVWGQVVGQPVEQLVGQLEKQLVGQVVGQPRPGTLGT